jgi:hypothetical protein
VAQFTDWGEEKISKNTITFLGNAKTKFPKKVVNFFDLSAGSRGSVCIRTD